ncbi:glycosyltransferase family 2 protein [Cellulomonas sp. PhB143]|uniref:glycosyltransferase family 2 protein n=1 Tax=Cellulomonas sp. PhB143 TaxID=2485186 RepID=UPI000F4764AC|nr:glycosyltransferase family 2 protein [Cellulomonas sp. PhB143]ROS78536.1 cellulose synthase/poly-beta-1,6-N-acetylglucosamine synthase-like glycosyltransferase [Cellulomonas sp. PhB143]
MPDHPNVPEPSGDAPGVSVFLAVRNEETHLAECLERLLAQDYAGPYEVVLAVGPSSDRTAEIAAAAAMAHPALTVVANPSGATPSGLNAAIAAARHDLLVRVDGHSIVAPDYVARTVATMLRTGAANVGGVMVPLGDGALQSAVARAMSSRFGIGPVGFHTGGHEGPSRSVYLGAFRRDALVEVGGYDETYLRAQDWELNHRLRHAGHVVWFDPSLRVGYRPRSTWPALARQFHGSGRWRRDVAQRHRGTLSARYLAPPAAVLGCALGLLLGVLGLAVGGDTLSAFLLLPAAYLVLLVVAVALAGRGLSGGARLCLPGVLATMHMAWGIGFLRGGVRESLPRVRPGDRPRVPTYADAPFVYFGGVDRRRDLTILDTEWDNR